MAKGPMKSILDGNGSALRDAIEKPIEAGQSQEAVSTDPQSRARAFEEYIQQGRQRFGCDLAAFVEVQGIVIPVPLKIIPK